MTNFKNNAFALRTRKIMVDVSSRKHNGTAIRPAGIANIFGNPFWKITKDTPFKFLLSFGDVTLGL
jgi:hypothetical protein